MSNGPFLLTERLILRPPSAEDLDGWAAFAADPETNRFLGGTKSRPEAWRMLCAMAGAWTIRMPRVAASSRANSASPDLSLTLINARRILTRGVMATGLSAASAMVNGSQNGGGYSSRILSRNVSK